MLSSLTTGGSPFLTKLIAKAWPWVVFSAVGLLMAQWVSSPSYAWWFTPASPTTAVTPVHQQGLVLSPIASSLVPQFILQPLSTTVAEAAPTATATPTPEATPKPIKASLSVAPAKKVVVASAAVAPDASMAEKILALVNAQRQAHGLNSLTLNNSLSASAQAYAQRMASEHFFSHVSPDGVTFKQRNEGAGYDNWTWMGENIAYGQTSAEMVMSDWMNSADHRANILNEHAKELGVGYAVSSTRYWVQEFGAR